MAIKVSTAKLAAAVANCGGVGVIAASGLTEEELRDQIRLARKLQENRDGLIAVNIMFAAREFNMLVKISIEEGIDLIIFGAGFSRDIFALGKESGTPIVPIVSSPKLAVMSKKLGATTVIVESGQAGGHLGTDKTTKELIPCVRKALDEATEPGEEKVSLVAAGGISTGKDIIDLLRLGADAVQMGTRFVLSKECEVHENFKKLFLNKSIEDVLIQSPVGLPARALKNAFVEKILNGEFLSPKSCESCLKKCSRSFCIMKALRRSQEGDIDTGLVFTGGSVKNFSDILSVSDIFKRLENEARAYLGLQEEIKV
jgi:NAD(P)H-dependent flavin oxidoreductase YrpB (nitropropane dioxygenase family)